MTSGRSYISAISASTTATRSGSSWPRRAWPSGYATTESRAQRVYEPTVDQPGPEGILMAYCGGQGGREWALLDESTRVEQAARLMAEMHGLTDEHLGGWSRAEVCSSPITTTAASGGSLPMAPSEKWWVAVVNKATTAT